MCDNRKSTQMDTLGKPFWECPFQLRTFDWDSSLLGQTQRSGKIVVNQSRHVLQQLGYKHCPSNGVHEAIMYVMCCWLSNYGSLCMQLVKSVRRFQLTRSRRLLENSNISLHASLPEKISDSPMSVLTTPPHVSFVLSRFRLLPAGWHKRLFRCSGNSELCSLMCEKCALWCRLPVFQNTFRIPKLWSFV